MTEEPKMVQMLVRWEADLPMPRINLKTVNGELVFPDSQSWVIPEGWEAVVTIRKIQSDNIGI